jgi:hypothetical protein
MLAELLQVAKTILNRQLVGMRSLLRELATEAVASRGDGCARAAD